MKKLVIIGGGFAGAKIAKALESEFNVTLIDSKDYFEFTPSILRAIVKTKHLKKIQILHKYYLKKSKIIKGCVKEINKDKVILENNSQLKFDYLVICSGSNYNSPFKEQNIVIAARGNHLKNYHSKLEKSKDITIIGGGLVGIELAWEIVWKYPSKKVTIIQSRKTILSRNHQKTINHAKKYLEKKRVKIIYNEKAITQNKSLILTDKGTKIKSDLVFLCTGISPNSEFLNHKFKKNLDNRKHIKVNSNLQLENYPNIFVAGDVNNIPEEKTAQSAEKQAEIVIENIKNLELKKELIQYIPKEKPMVISLGKYNGIFEYKKIVLTGIIPAFLKWFVEKKTITRYKN